MKQAMRTRVEKALTRYNHVKKKKKIIMEFFLGSNIWEYRLVFGIQRKNLTIELVRRQSEKDVSQIRHQIKQFAVS